mgnify:CR=1 FL=1
MDDEDATRQFPKAMIWNIIDHRTRRHRWASIEAVVEPTFHDNSVADADQAPSEQTYLCEMRDGISLAEAISWANSFDCPTTLYLYDDGAAPLTADDEAEEDKSDSGKEPTSE